MPIQVIHEAEHTRQHARYIIPARLEIGHESYELANWSVSGLAIKDIEDTKKQFFDAKIIFDFETFHVQMDIQLQKKSYNKKERTMGCSYSNLSKDKLSLFHYIINSYISGDLITVGSLIEVVKKDRFTKKDVSKILNPDMTPIQKIFLRIKQLTIYIVLTTIILLLSGFILFTSYNKLFVVESLSATVDAPIVIIRSPQASYYNAIKNKVGEHVKRGSVIASMKLIGGGTNTIESPVSGEIIIQHAIDKTFVDKGEALITIAPEGIEPYIEAKIKSSQSPKLSLGQHATIKLVDGTHLQATVTKITTPNSPVMLHSTLQTQPVSTFDYISVELKTDEKLDIKHLGEVASVKIDTLNLNKMLD